MRKAFCIDLSARLSVRSLILALLTALTSAECTLSATGPNPLHYELRRPVYDRKIIQISCSVEYLK